MAAATLYHSNTLNASCSGAINVTSPEAVPAYLYTNKDRVLIIIVYPIILAIGIIANVAFIAVMLRIPRMKTTVNLYLSNLAIADVSFLTFAVASKLRLYLSSPVNGDYYVIGRCGCMMSFTLVNASYFVSLFLITLITVEKYNAICKPILHLLNRSRKRSIRLILFGWLVALCFACVLIPAYTVFKTYCMIWPSSRDSGDLSNLPDVIGLCRPIEEWTVTFYNAMQTIPFFVTFAVNLSLGYKIVRAIRLRARVIPGDSHQSTISANGSNPSSRDPRHAQRVKTQNQVTRMLIINGVVFFACLAPFQCLSFVSMITASIDGKYLLTDQQYESLSDACRILTYINSAINPYIYVVTNSRYRQAFKDTFCCNLAIFGQARVAPRRDEHSILKTG